jgi:hypothetical protein
VAGKNGVEVKQEVLAGEIIKQFGKPGGHVIQIPTSIVETKENGEMVRIAIQSLDKWGKKKLSLRFRDFEKLLNTDEISRLFGLMNEQIDNGKFETLVGEIKPDVEVELRDGIAFENNRVNNLNRNSRAKLTPEFRTKLAQSMISLKTTWKSCDFDLSKLRPEI